MNTALHMSCLHASDDIVVSMRSLLCGIWWWSVHGSSLERPSLLSSIAYNFKHGGKLRSAESTSDLTQISSPRGSVKVKQIATPPPPVTTTAAPISSTLVGVVAVRNGASLARVWSPQPSDAPKAKKTLASRWTSSFRSRKGQSKSAITSSDPNVRISSDPSLAGSTESLFSAMTVSTTDVEPLYDIHETLVELGVDATPEADVVGAGGLATQFFGLSHEDPSIAPDRTSPSIENCHEVPACVECYRTTTTTPVSESISFPVTTSRIPARGLVRNVVYDGYVFVLTRREGSKLIVDVAAVGSAAIRGQAEMIVQADCESHHVLVKYHHLLTSMRRWRLTQKPVFLSAPTPVDSDGTSGCRRTRRVLILEKAGMSLHDYRKGFLKKRVPLDLTIQIGMELLTMLLKLHQSGFAHGNISPFSVALWGPASSSPSDGLVLTNFGILSRPVRDNDFGNDALSDTRRLVTIMVEMHPPILQLLRTAGGGALETSLQAVFQLANSATSFDQIKYADIRERLQAAHAAVVH